MLTSHTSLKPEITQLVQLAQLRYLEQVTPAQMRQSEQAIGLLLKRFQPLFNRFLYQFKRLDPQDCHGAILDGLHQAIETYRPELSQFGTWLRLKIRSKLIDLAERQTRQQQRIQLYCQATTQRQYVEDSFEDIYFLREILATLPPETQTLFALYAEGYTWVEIGEQIGKKPDTARIAFSRAIAKVKANFLSTSTGDGGMSLSQASWAA